jgi:hypothetical protein
MRGLLATTLMTALVAGTVVASAQQPATEPLPRTGEFSLVFTFVNVEPWAPIPRATDAAGAVTETATVATNIAWLMNTAGSGFGHQMTGRCGTLQRLQGTTVLESRGNCVYTDAQGDMLFEEFERGPGDAFTTGRWIGGTGKYAGVSSTFEIRGTPGFAGRTEGGAVGGGTPGLNELYGMSTGIKTGTYTLPPL